MTDAIEHVPVTFRGEGSGVGELSWGQRDIWLSMTRYQSPMPLGGVKPLDAGTSVADVVEELRYLMNRYPVMRTRLIFDASGEPQQVVSASGTIVLDVVDTGGADPDGVAESIAHRYRDQPFDYVEEWPVRIGVVRHRSELTHMVVIMCHLALDGFAGMVMMQEVAAREPAPVTGMQPLEQARWQRSAAGQRQNEAALRYLEGLFAAMPAAWVGSSADRRVPRHWEGEFDSAAMLLAARAAAARGGVDTAPVLLAAFAIALGRLTGINPVAVRPVVSNRFRPGFATVVCPLSQPGLCLIDVADIPFDEAVERARRSSMTAYKYAYCDPMQAQALIRRVTEERGPGFDVDCYFNDRRGTDPAVGTASSPQALTEALTASVFRWTATKDSPSARLFVQVDDLPGAIRLNIFADTHHVSPGDAEALLREMEAVLIEVAFDGEAPTRVGPAILAGG